MLALNLYDRNLENEFRFEATRSSGPGGQNVNKVNTRVELRFCIHSSSLFVPEEKERLLEVLRNKINKDGELIIVSQSERTQLGNKEKCIEKFYLLLNKVLTPKKKRKATRPTISSRVKRLESKKIESKKKQLRRGSIED